MVLKYMLKCFCLPKRYKSNNYDPKVIGSSDIIRKDEPWRSTTWYCHTFGIIVGFPNVAILKHAVKHASFLHVVYAGFPGRLWPHVDGKERRFGIAGPAA
jgi:hypothetical protein